MSGFGKQRGEIYTHYIGSNDNGNAFVGFKIYAEHWDDPLTSKVYLTKAAMGIARAKLKACGFDIDKQPLRLLDEQPELLQGTHIEVEVTEEVYNNKPYTKCEIVTGFGKVDAAKLDELTEQLRAAKGSEGGPAKAAPSKASRRARPSSGGRDPEPPPDLDPTATQSSEEPLVTPDNDPPPAAAAAPEHKAETLEDADIPF